MTKTDKLALLLIISDEENNMLCNTISTRTIPTVKRNLTMNHHKALISYINELILDKAEHTIDGYLLSVDDLSSIEQGNLAALFLEYDDRDTSDCFHENKRSIEDNITCALLKLLKNDSNENHENLSLLIRANTIKSYRNRMQEMIDDQCAELSLERSMSWRQYA